MHSRRVRRSAGTARPSFLRRLAPILALLATAGCGDERAAPPDSPRAPESDRSGVTTLVALLPDAHTSGGPATIDLDDPGADRWLRAGWFEVDDFDAPAVTHQATAEILLVDPRNRRLAIELRDAAAAPELALAWNGAPLEARTAAGRIEAEIPAEVQRRGPNALRIGLPDRGDGRPALASTFVRSITLDPGEDGAAPTVAGASMVQRTGSAVAFDLLLPPSARLRGRASSRGGAAAGGTLFVAVTTDGGHETLLERRVADLPAALDLALPEGAASLTLGVSPEGAAAAEVSWEALEISGAEAGAASPAPARVPAGRRPRNVLVVLFDSLRADHLEPYGAASVATPALARLALGGATFSSAYSNSSNTRTSVSSLLTSSYPERHQTSMTSSMPAEAPYLPEILKGAGYATLCVTKSPQVALEFGFGRGFDRFHFLRDPGASGKPDGPAERAEATLQGMIDPFLAERGTRPFFIYLHEVDPHSPYEPPSPYDVLAAGTPRKARHKEHLVEAGGRKGAPGPRHAARELSYYQGEVGLMDTALDGLLRSLQRRGALQDTLVLFVADHGEEFLEHGAMGHSRTLYEECLRIPMLWWSPGLIPAGTVVPTPVELLDVPVTILDLLGLPVPPAMQGQSLAPLLLGATAGAPARPLFAQVRSRQMPQDAVRAGDVTLVRRQYRGRTQWELYDLASDPSQRRSVWADRLQTGRSLAALLERQHRIDRALGVTTREVGLEEMKQETRDELRALGYLE